jgi:hypothetical protein
MLILPSQISCFSLISKLYLIPVNVEFDLRPITCPITCPKRSAFTPGKCQA